MLVTSVCYMLNGCLEEERGMGSEIKGGLEKCFQLKKKCLYILRNVLCCYELYEKIDWKRLAWAVQR